jgi:small subunit ribosomal protein S8
MSIDTIGDFLTIIRNGLMVGKRYVETQHSRLKEQIAQVLKDEGYIKDFKSVQEGSKKYITIVLKYVGKESVIHELTRVSTPGRRHYEKRKDLTPVIGGLGVSILTTNRGIMSDKQAKKMNVGGEVICHIW